MPLYEPERTACAFCGHPTGDCVADGHEFDGIVPIGSGIGRAPGASEGNAPTFRLPASPDPAATVVVQEEVWEEFTLRGSTEIGHRLAYRPGDRITPAEAERLGVRPVQSAPVPPIPLETT